MIKYIRKAQKVEEKYCYNFSLLSAVIKSDIVQNNEIFWESHLKIGRGMQNLGRGMQLY